MNLRKGFTIIEIVSVLAIIAVIMVIGFVMFNVIQARNQARANDVLMANIREQVRSYINTKNISLQDDQPVPFYFTIQGMYEEGFLSSSQVDNLKRIKEQSEPLFVSAKLDNESVEADILTGDDLHSRSPNVLNDNYGIRLAEGFQNLVARPGRNLPVSFYLVDSSGARYDAIVTSISYQAGGSNPRPVDFTQDENGNYNFVFRVPNGFSMRTFEVIVETELGTTIVLSQNPTPDQLLNPCRIRTISMLDNMRSQTGCPTFYLENNLNMSGVDWTPIAPFGSNFNGQGNTIFNYSGNSGLFDTAGIPNPPWVQFMPPPPVPSTISNLNLVNVNINANINGHFGVGALVNRHVAGDMKNVTVSGTITNTGTTPTGGVVGTSGGFATINNVTSSVNVNATSASGTGGIAGSGTVRNSSASGRITGGNDTGGLVGGGTAINSFATGNVSGSHNVGGILGRGTANNSFATGNVNGLSNVGGLIGFDDYGLSNTFATGNVTGTSNVGGLAGATECESHGISNSYATGNVTANNLAGGIVSQVDDVGSNHWNITNTFFTGNINLNSGSPSSFGTNITAQSLRASLPNGFNSNVWRINPNVNNGFPCLIGVTPGC